MFLDIAQRVQSDFQTLFHQNPIESRKHTNPKHIYPQKEFKIHINIQILIRFLKKCSSLLLRQRLSNVLQSGHLLRQLRQLQTAATLPPHRHELKATARKSESSEKQEEDNSKTHRRFQGAELHLSELVLEPWIRDQDSYITSHESSEISRAKGGVKSERKWRNWGGRKGCLSEQETLGTGRELSVGVVSEWVFQIFWEFKFWRYYPLSACIMRLYVETYKIIYIGKLLFIGKSNVTKISGKGCLSLYSTVSPDSNLD